MFSAFLNITPKGYFFFFFLFRLGFPGLLRVTYLFEVNDLITLTPPHPPVCGDI
jgi:hypothetical protein